MFSLFHFSRVFPYIHPYLFPPGAAKPADPAAKASAEPVAATGVELGADAAATVRAGQVRRLKSLYRRQLRNHRNDLFTYSGALRRAVL